MIATIHSAPVHVAPAGARSLFVPMDTGHEDAAGLQRDELQQFRYTDVHFSGGLPPPPLGTAQTFNLDAALDAADNTIAADIAAFMLLYAKLVQEARHTARASRAVELQAQVTAIQAAAEEMRTAATQRFSAAVMAGTMQMVGGALTVASACHSLKQLGNATPNDLAAGSAFLAKLTASQQLWSGGGQMVEGMGKLCSASMEQAAALADARAKDADAVAAKAQAERDADQELAQAMADTLRDIREKLGAIQQSATEMNRGIARNI